MTVFRPTRFLLSGNPLSSLTVLVEGGYLTAQGYSTTPLRTIIPAISHLLTTFRSAKYPIYFTREGHRPDLSTLSSRELFRSRNNPSGTGIGDPAPDPKFGRQLIRGCYGHEIIDELTPHITDQPENREFVIDKPGRSAFAHTELELMLRIRGVRNLLICGVTTDVCVSSTMREANDRGFDCLLVENATAAGEEEGWRGAVESVKGEGGIFGTVGRVNDVVRAVEGSVKAGLMEVAITDR